MNPRRWIQQSRRRAGRHRRRSRPPVYLLTLPDPAPPELLDQIRAELETAWLDGPRPMTFVIPPGAAMKRVR